MSGPGCRWQETLNNKAGGPNMHMAFTDNGRKWVLGGLKQPLFPLVELIYSLQSEGQFCGPRTTWRQALPPCPSWKRLGLSDCFIPSSSVQCLRLNGAWLCCNHSRVFILGLCVIKSFNNIIAPPTYSGGKKKKQETARMCMSVCL